MDSGATSHMSFNQGIMQCLMSCNLKFIMGGNGVVILINSVGQSSFPYSNNTLLLKDKLFYDKIVKNLIFVRPFCIDNSVYVEFDPFAFSVKDLSTSTLLQRFDRNPFDLYPVIPSTIKSALTSALVAASFDTLHHHLGHTGTAILKFLQSYSFISCSIKSSSLCHACQVRKHYHLPFTLLNTKTSHVFELIHSDLWTSPFISLSGFK